MDSKKNGKKKLVYKIGENCKQEDYKENSLRTTMNNDTYLVVAEITSLTMHVTRFGTDADKGLSP